jgi:two-component sensor histidine kinase
VIHASQAPLLLLDGDSCVIASSQSFLTSFGYPSVSVRGRSLFSLGGGEWDVPRLRSLLSAVGSGDAVVDAYELDWRSPRGDRRTLLLTAQRLDFTEGPAFRIMLTVVDATEAMAAEKLRNDLIRDKDVLLREVQHRVANSLQIIASVLLQNARKVSSEESRLHLRDAHQRVMSVAAIQRQLAASSLSDVPLKPYLTQLCLSIGASMIGDHDLVSIEVNGDGSATTGEVSVSLGLIVTELVINALKHAFPPGQRGLVTVDYHSEFEGWALSVCDDGVGMPETAAEAKAGLGTAIVQALAAQLSAEITVTALKPGTGVSVVHRNPRGASNDAARPELRAV